MVPYRQEEKLRSISRRIMHPRYFLVSPPREQLFSHTFTTEKEPASLGKGYQNRSLKVIQQVVRIRNV